MALAIASRPEATAESSALNTLRTAILAGRLRPGQRLRQVELAGQLGVSRIPLRDAFRRLEAEGLVRIEGRHGARVAALTAADINEIYEMRLLLEAHCLKLAVRNVTAEGVAELFKLARRMDEHPAGEEGQSARRSFYATLYGWADRPKMVEVILRLRADVHRYHVLSDDAASHDAHSRLLELIEARDARGAASLMRRHLQDACQDLEAVLVREELQQLRDDGAAGADVG